MNSNAIFRQQFNIEYYGKSLHLRFIKKIDDILNDPRDRGTWRFAWQMGRTMDHSRSFRGMAVSVSWHIRVIMSTRSLPTRICLAIYIWTTVHMAQHISSTCWVYNVGRLECFSSRYAPVWQILVDGKWLEPGIHLDVYDYSDSSLRLVRKSCLV